MDFLGLLHIRAITLWDVLDILLMWLVIYNLLKMLHGTRAMQMAFGIMALFMVQVVADILNLTVLEKIISSLLTIIPIAVIVLFQAEIRKALISIGRNPFINLVPEPERGYLDQVFFSVRYFSERRIGSLIVFENTQTLTPYVEIGTPLDALPSSDLLMNIFDPKSNLHDGAVLISNGRLASAASVLPLTTKTNLPKHFGTRHRAGIGITEETDCLVVIVSEESGQITFVKDGTRYTPSDTSTAKLRQLFEAIMDAGKQKPGKKEEAWWIRLFKFRLKSTPEILQEPETKPNEPKSKSARSL